MRESAILGALEELAHRLHNFNASVVQVSSKANLDIPAWDYKDDSREFFGIPVVRPEGKPLEEFSLEAGEVATLLSVHDHLYYPYMGGKVASWLIINPNGYDELIIK